MQRYAAAMALHASATARPGGWHDHYWWSKDEVRLHARIYGASTDGDDAATEFGAGSTAGRPAILCLPGLTRNARDFDGLAPYLAARARVIAVDLRGRGESGHARDAMSYVPLTYVQDVVALLDDLGIDRVICIGTSLGGIVTMMLAATQPGRVSGAVLNDIGPDIDPAGLARIRGYVGQMTGYPTWVHAARAIGAAGAALYPGWSLEDWLRMVKRSHRLTQEGLIVPDYDDAIAQPFKVPGGEAGVDLWSALAALAPVPVAVIRGEMSDLLSPATAARMCEQLPGARLTTVAGVGHAPMLDEAAAIAAIDALLDRVAAA